MDAFKYTIEGDLSQLTLEIDDWYFIRYFYKKMISIKTCYKIHN